MKRLRASVLITTLLLMMPVLMVPVNAADEGAVSILNSLHLEIVNEHLTASWTGAAPGTASTNVEFRAFIHNPEKHFLTLKVVEKQAPHRQLSVQAKDGEVQELAFVALDDKHVATLTQNDGAVSFAPPGTSGPFRAASFRDLIRQQTGAVQSGLLHPLAEFGVTIEWSADLPVVMALASSGYAPADAATARRIDALLPQLTDKDEAVSAKAKAELTKLYPLAVKHLTDLATTTSDAALKAQLTAVIAAHPGIARAREYVEKNQLQNNRTYLKGIVDGVPLLSEAAKMRLQELDAPAPAAK